MSQFWRGVVLLGVCRIECVFFGFADMSQIGYVITTRQNPPPPVYVFMSLSPPHHLARRLIFVRHKQSEKAFIVFMLPSFIWHTQFAGREASVTFSKKSRNQQAKFDTIRQNFDAKVYSKLDAKCQIGVCLRVCVSV